MYAFEEWRIKLPITEALPPEVGKLMVEHLIGAGMVMSGLSGKE